MSEEKLLIVDNIDGSDNTCSGDYCRRMESMMRAPSVSDKIVSAPCQHLFPARTYRLTQALEHRNTDQTHTLLSVIYTNENKRVCNVRLCTQSEG